MTALGLVGAAVIGASIFTLREKKVDDYDLYLRAAQKTAEAFAILRNDRLARDIRIDSVNDPAESGLIGMAESPITSSFGDIESERTSINPNWSTAIIQYLKKAGVRQGDRVAISMTGSFPALNIAALIAIQELGARPYWIVTESSSAWGANIPAFTWLHMEKILFDHKLFHGRAIAASLGGDNDIGAGLSSEGRDTLRSIILKSKIPLLEVVPFDSSIITGMRALKNAMNNKKPALFITIGGGSASLGTSEVGLILKSGLNSPKQALEIKDQPVQGYVAHFLKSGVPVLNILDVVSLAKKVKLTVDPVITPLPGEGALFSQPRYNIALTILLLVVFVGIVAAVSLGVFDFFFKNPRKEEMV
jgi:poly-gamma-glutamate system protein